MQFLYIIFIDGHCSIHVWNTVVILGISWQLLLPILGSMGLRSCPLLSHRLVICDDIAMIIACCNIMYITFILLGLYITTSLLQIFIGILSLNRLCSPSYLWLCYSQWILQRGRCLMTIHAHWSKLSVNRCFDWQAKNIFDLNNYNIALPPI